IENLPAGCMEQLSEPTARFIHAGMEIDPSLRGFRETLFEPVQVIQRRTVINIMGHEYRGKKPEEQWRGNADCQHPLHRQCVSKEKPCATNNQQCPGIQAPVVLHYLPHSAISASFETLIHFFKVVRTPFSHR